MPTDIFAVLGGTSPYDPAITAESAGSSLVGTMAQPEPQPGPDMDRFHGLQEQTKKANEPPDVPVGKATVDGRTGRWSFSDVSPKFLSEVMGSMNDLKTMQQAAMARVAQLKQQESSGSPLLDALSQLAGGMAANDPTMPGWVRALGATSLQMGPQGIKRERMAEEARAAELAKDTAAIGLRAEQLQSQKEEEVQKRILAQQTAMDKADKDLQSFLIGMRREGRQQVNAAGVYDKEGFAEELRSKRIPEEQIAAQIATLDQYAADWRKLKDEEKNAKTNEERIEWQRKMDLWRDTQERIDKRAQDRLAGAFGWNTMRSSLPQKADTDVINSSARILASLADAEKFIGSSKVKYKGGPVAGIIAENNPWRDPKKLEAMFTSYQMTLEFLKASGLAPISEIEFKNQRDLVFNQKLTFDQAKALVARMKEVTERGIQTYMLTRPQVNWDITEPALPEGARKLLPDLRRRREELYMGAAPPFMRSNEEDPEFAAAKAAKVGAIVTIGGVKYKKTGANQYDPVVR